MKSLHPILSLVVCIPLGAICGGLYGLGTNSTLGVIGGAFMGLVMDLAFDGVERVADFLYGPK